MHFDQKVKIVMLGNVHILCEIFSSGDMLRMFCIVASEPKQIIDYLGCIAKCIVHTESWPAAVVNIKKI